MTKPMPPKGLRRPQASFRPATPDDLSAMMALVADAQAALRDQGVDQWQNGYPDEPTLLADMAKGGSCVLLLDDQVVAMMALLPGPDPTYGVIDGAWLTDGDYYVIHRLAVLSRHKGAGVAARMLHEAEALCRTRGIPAIRVDTHHDNQPMQRFLTKNGFTPCGDIRLEDGSPRIAFEKRVPPEAAQIHP